MSRRRLTVTQFLQGAVKAARSAAAPTTSASTERLATCMSCPSIDREHERCLICGCPVRRKVKLHDEACPIGRW
ncbi:MAG: hypothetical protein FGM24_04400 [Candidatus Kapabacteria bacterium]|nr:hypothetical protein [Candidatus Kapabacteria bacterium]